MPGPQAYARPIPPALATRDGPVPYHRSMSLIAHAVDFGYVKQSPVLNAINSTFEPGTLTTLIGPNGAGKSTLLRLLAGLGRPDAGTVRLDDQDVAGISPRTRASLIGFIPQQSSLAFSFTVRQVVRLGLYATRINDNDQIIDDALGQMDVADRADTPFGCLSVGQQQRVTIARVLAQIRATDIRGTRVLLADEPASALDPKHTLQTLSLLRQIAAQGFVVVVVVHDLSMALRFSDRAVLLNEHGAIAAQGPAEEILEASTLSGVFGVGFESLRGKSPESRALIPIAAPADTMG